MLNVKQILTAFIAHRKEVITRRTVFELDAARKREHILLGLKIALDNIDEGHSHHQGKVATFKTPGTT